jgi:hypothetical protein
MRGTFTEKNVPNPNQTYMVILGQTKRMKVNFKDNNNVDYDPTTVSLTVYRPDNIVYFTETYPTVGGNIIKETKGNYYVDFKGDPNYIGDYQFIWSWNDSVGGEQFTGVQSITIMPIEVLPILPNLRNQLDKAKKSINKFFGYNDENLYYYIKGAVSRINIAPPNTTFTIQTFPYVINSQLIIDVATFIALEAQGLCAIDTDVPSYSLQGNALNIDHWSRISAYLSMLEKRADTELGNFKLDFLTRIGAVKSERGPGFRQISVFQASPSGTSFGNTLGVR